MRTALAPLGLSALTALVLSASSAAAQESAVKTISNIVRPKKLEPTDERVASLRLPEGFRIAKLAEGLGNVRMMAVGPDGSIYITRREEGDLLRLRDADGDGKAEEKSTVLKMDKLHGVCIHEGTIYLASVKEVHSAKLNTDGSLGELKKIAQGLPDAGQHPNRTLAVGPDGKLYLTVGSTCNSCRESSPESATILRSGLDGSNRAVFAKGLRNTIGFGWHPQTGELWGMDHGIDHLGDDARREELNKLVEGRDYGWPFVYEDGKLNPAIDLPPGMSEQEVIAHNTPPELTYTAHASPLGMVFIGDQKSGGRPMFPAEYTGDALVSFRGSWNRDPASGYEVARVRFDGGKPVEFRPFLRGFLIDGGKAHFGRPVGLAFAKDGSLLVSDDTCGVVYRVWHEGR